MATLFISDLHLCAARPAITELFLDLLRNRASHAEALYILGDLFEYWIGDEATQQDEFHLIIQGLRAFTNAGVPVFVMRGNRDFLMGERFEKETGCRLIPDPTLIDLYGKTVLLMHGDTLCTDDTEYMNFRALVRNEKWQKEFLSRNLEERDAIFRSFREISKAATAQKKPEIMDVNQQAVESVMRSHGIHDLIHGHTHRPAEHIFNLDGRRARRRVLGDWYEQGSVLRCDENGWVLTALPLVADRKQKAGY